jgi:NifB/MoaA-like Fe-S oxidoreductase
MIMELLDRVRWFFDRREQVDVDVMLCPEDRRDELREACDDDDRWLYAGTPTSEEVMWILGGERDEPWSGMDEDVRVADAISHEVMHNVLHRVESLEASVQYDDLIEDVIDVPVYLHHYGRGDAHIIEYVDDLEENEM